MKGGFGCSTCCGTPPCEKCTRTCTNPHTGSAFQEVWQVWSFGAVDGRATDGYLTFSGDSDAAAGVMVGDGPFYQQIGGSFYLDSSVSRFPCSLTVSFWRTLFPATATTDTELSSNTVTITCVTGQFVIRGGMTVLNPGESYTFSPAVPLVGLLAGDPHSASGTFGGVATCNGTLVSIQGRIAWSNSERIHGLHGIVRECYEPAGQCADACSGNPSPSVVYLTISNYSGPTYDSPTPMDIEGTYVLERVPGFCNYYRSEWTSNLCFSLSNPLGAALYAPIEINGWGLEKHGLYMAHYVQISGVCSALELFSPDETFVICGSGVLFSGTNGQVRVNGGTVINNAFDWEIEV